MNHVPAEAQDSGFDCPVSDGEMVGLDQGIGLSLARTDQPKSHAERAGLMQ